MVGVLALLFTAVPSARISTTARVNTTTIASSLVDTTDDVTVAAPLNATTIPTTYVDQERLTFTFWLYLAVRVCYG